MSRIYSIAILIGSLRRDSTNRKIATALNEMTAGKLTLNIVEIGDLPLYNQDLD